MRFHRILIPLAALLAVLPMLLHGPSCGHDFDFHLLNWLEANTQLHHLTWPRWAYTPAWNAGEPRFLFYPPLSWLLGAALTQVLPFPLVSSAYTWIALTLSGFTLHRFAAPYVSPGAATLAAIVYLANPYMLFTAYERTAYAELLAAAFIPLLFAAILAPRPRVAAIAVPVALLWLTNAPAAVMGSYALALLTAVRLALESFEVWRGRLRLAGTAAGGTILGLALAAFYIVPAAYQRRFVQIKMAVIAGMTPADNFLFHHTPAVSDDAIAHDVVLHTASVIAVLLLVTTVILLVFDFFRRARKRDGLPLLPLAVLAGAVAVLLTPVSLPLWNHVPELAFLQFPWRLLALVGPVLALALAMAWGRLSVRWAAVGALGLGLAGVLIAPSWHMFQQVCDVPDTPEARAALFHSPLGTEPTDEYTPLDADPDALHPEDPPYWVIPQSGSVDTPAPPNAAAGPVPDHLVLNLAVPEVLVLNRREYPLWRVEVNRHPADSVGAQRTDGLIAVALPAGADTVDLKLRHTGDEIVGIVLSAFALAGLLARHLRTTVSQQKAG